jgi:hypothetical protein
MDEKVRRVVPQVQAAGRFEEPAGLFLRTYRFGGRATLLPAAT